MRDDRGLLIETLEAFGLLEPLERFVSWLANTKLCQWLERFRGNSNKH